MKSNQQEWTAICETARSGYGKRIKQFRGADRIKSCRTAINFFQGVRHACNALPTFNRFC